MMETVGTMGAVMAFSRTTLLTPTPPPLPEEEEEEEAVRTTPVVDEVVLTSAVEVVFRRLMVTVFMLMLGDPAGLPPAGWMGVVWDLAAGLAGEDLWCWEEEEETCLPWLLLLLALALAPVLAWKLSFFALLLLLLLLLALPPLVGVEDLWVGVVVLWVGVADLWAGADDLRAALAEDLAGGLAAAAAAAGCDPGCLAAPGAAGDLLPPLAAASGCLKGDPFTPLETRFGVRSMFWLTCRGEAADAGDGEEEEVGASGWSSAPLICTTEEALGDGDGDGDADAREATDVSLEVGGGPGDLGAAPAPSNCDLMASKFFPENVLETTVFWTRTWLLLEEEEAWPPAVVVVELLLLLRFCSKMEIRSEMGLLPAWRGWGCWR